MKIICTQAEKERLELAFHYSDVCPFEDDVFDVCTGNCDTCEQVEKHIEWEITNAKNPTEEQ